MEAPFIRAIPPPPAADRVLHSHGSSVPLTSAAAAVATQLAAAHRSLPSTFIALLKALYQAGGGGGGGSLPSPVSNII